MKLVAELIDKVTPVLKDLQKAMRETSGSLKGGHEVAARAAREHSRHLKELHERLGKVKELVSNAVVPALAAMGITAFGVGATIGLLADKIKAAGESYHKLNDTISRGHVSVSYVKVLEGTFEDLGIGADRAHDAVAKMGEIFDQLRRGTNSEVRQKLQDAFPDMLPIVEDILKSSKTYEDAMNRIIHVTQGMNIDPDKKRRFLEAMGAPPELASRLREFDEALEANMESVRKHPPSLEAYKKIDEELVKLRRAQREFWNDLINDLGPHASRVIGLVAQDIKSLTEWIEKFKQHQASGERDDSRDRVLGVDPNLAKAFDDADKKVKEPVKQGVLEAFRIWAFENRVSDAEKFSGGYMPMAYHPDGGVGGRRGRGWGGAGYNLLPNGDTGAGMPGGAPEGSDAYRGLGGAHARSGVATPAGPAGNRSENAQRIYDELRRLGHSHEQASGALGHVQAESGFNPNATGDAGTAHGFFQHRGSRWASARRDAAQAGVSPFSPEAAARHFDRELHHEEGRAGRNYFKAQSVRDAVTALNAYERFAGWQRGQAARYRAAERFARTIRESHEQEAIASHGTSGAHLSDHVRNKSLLKAGKQSGILGPGTTRVTGDASLSIDLNGFPKGTRTRTAASGLFKEVTLNRGRPMNLASQDV